MRQTLDCAILHFDQTAVVGASGQTESSSRSGKFKQVVIKHRRLKVHNINLSDLVAVTDDVFFREEERKFLLLQLMRYDVVILLLNTESLSLARRFLFYLHSTDDLDEILCPVFALISDVNPVAMIDLMRLGLSDFMRYPVNQEELRARLVVTANKPRRHLQPESRLTVSALSDDLSSENYPGDPSSHASRQMFFEELLRTAEQRTGSYSFAFGDPDFSYFNEGFKEAKQKMIDRFECDYLSYVLSSAKGNIRKAADLAKKNRRSFWELMRKHQIDADQFRPDVY
ncbi:hypothetical protein AAEX37_00459 [Oligella sp. MSHR50489EDL]